MKVLSLHVCWFPSSVALVCSKLVLQGGIRDGGDVKLLEILKVWLPIGFRDYYYSSSFQTTKTYLLL